MSLTIIQQVRLLIGDTDTTDQVLTDEQIQYFLDTFGSAQNAAPEAAASAANVLAMRATSETTGGMSVDFTRRAELFRLRAIDLRTRRGSVGPAFTGGISQADLDSSKTDTSLPPRAFTVDLHEDE